MLYNGQPVCHHLQREWSHNLGDQTGLSCGHDSGMRGQAGCRIPHSPSGCKRQMRLIYPLFGRPTPCLRNCSCVQGSSVTEISDTALHCPDGCVKSRRQKPLRPPEKWEPEKRCNHLEIVERSRAGASDIIPIWGEGATGTPGTLVMSALTVLPPPGNTHQAFRLAHNHFVHWPRTMIISLAGRPTPGQLQHPCQTTTQINSSAKPLVGGAVDHCGSHCVHPEGKNLFLPATCSDHLSKPQGVRGGRLRIWAAMWLGA